MTLNCLSITFFLIFARHTLKLLKQQMISFPQSAIVNFLDIHHGCLWVRMSQSLRNDG